VQEIHWACVLGGRHVSGKPWNESKPYTDFLSRAWAMTSSVEPVYTPNSRAMPSLGASVSACSRVWRGE
jgi:hypothetical protein